VALQQASDVLVLAVWDTEHGRGVFPGKLFEYVGARRPILLVGRTDGVAADLLRARSCGVALAGVDELTAQIGRWVREKRDAGGPAAVPALEPCPLTREHQARRFEAVLNRVTRHAAV
jgi:hypothetical protein